MEREWQNWDVAGVAETIQAYWQASIHESAHRDTLVELASTYLTDPQAKVLEVGCGTGQIYKRLVPAVLANSRYVGVDVSHNMLQIARRDFPDGNFLHMDGYGLDFEDGAFDVVLCFEVLGHLPDIEKILHELLRVTKKTCIFTVWPSTSDEILSSSEQIDGTSFVHRQFPHAYLEQLIRAHQPQLADAFRVAVIAADTWAYIVAPGGGLAASSRERMFPFPGHTRRMVRLADARMAEARLHFEAELGRATTARDQFEAELGRVTAARDQFEAELGRVTAARDQFEAELGRVTEARQRLEAELRGVTEARDQLHAELAQVSAARDDFQAEVSRLTQTLGQLRASHADLQGEVERMLSSKSWRVTKPLRAAWAAGRRLYQAVYRHRHS